MGRRKEDPPGKSVRFRLGLVVKKAPVLTGVLAALAVLSVPTFLLIGANAEVRRTTEENRATTVRICEMNGIMVRILTANPEASGRKEAIAELETLAANCTTPGRPRP